VSALARHSHLSVVRFVKELCCGVCCSEETKYTPRFCPRQHCFLKKQQDLSK
jgi:hypothetical protein